MNTEPYSSRGFFLLIGRFLFTFATCLTSLDILQFNLERPKQRKAAIRVLFDLKVGLFGTRRTR